MTNNDEIVRLAILQHKITVGTASQSEDRNFGAALKALVDEDRPRLSLAMSLLAGKNIEIQVESDLLIANLTILAEFLGGSSQILDDEPGAVRAIFRPLRRSNLS
jgi:hypothetical protein